MSITSQYSYVLVTRGLRMGPVVLITEFALRREVHFHLLVLVALAVYGGMAVLTERLQIVQVQNFDAKMLIRFVMGFEAMAIAADLAKRTNEAQKFDSEFPFRCLVPEETECLD